jgi:hypothetical protein
MALSFQRAPMSKGCPLAGSGGAHFSLLSAAGYLLGLAVTVAMPTRVAMWKVSAAMLA